ncbi:hypothetical protein REPUB_Repub20aG0142100 [Reevesia pubescens]
MNDDNITIVSHFNPNPNKFRTFTVNFFSEPISTTVTSTPSVVRNWLFKVLHLHRIRRNRLVIGLGVQWNPCSSNIAHPSAATLQLCIGRKCLIFQLLHANHVPLSLRRFLADPRNTFVGVWNHSDEAMLLRSKHGISVSRLVDARDVAAEESGISPRLSMEKLAEIFLGADEVKKPKRIGVSAWDSYWLSLEQIQYACVSFELGKTLKIPALSPAGEIFLLYVPEKGFHMIVLSCPGERSSSTFAISLNFKENRNTIHENHERFQFSNYNSAKLDRLRGDRYGNTTNNQDSYYNNNNNNHNRNSRGPSRFSDAPPPPMNRYNNNHDDNNSNFDDKFDNQDSYHHHRRRSPSDFRGSGGGRGGGEGEGVGGGHRPFDSPPRQHYSSGGRGGGFRPIGVGVSVGGGFGPMSGGFEDNYPPPPLHPPQQAHIGQKRAFPFSGRGGGGSPNRDRLGGAGGGGGGNFAKLFVGSVPKTATEDDIQPIFEEHGNVIEVALIKDKRTGQPQEMDGNSVLCVEGSLVICLLELTWDVTDIIWFQFSNYNSAKLDRLRGDRYGNTTNNQDSYYNNNNNNHNRNSRGPSRFSDAPPPPMNRYNNNHDDNNSNFDDKFDNQDSYHHHRRRSPSDFRGSGGGRGGGEGEGGGGGHRPFDSPPRQHYSSGGRGGGFRPIGVGVSGGGGFGPMSGGFEDNYPPPPLHPPQQAHIGQKRAFPFSGRGGGGSPNRDRLGGAGGGGGGNFAKLFVGSVPKTATEDDIQPIFEEHGNVIEVALIKDKRTGQPQGCCFIKYATLEEADRAIRALHNQHTLPGGVGPIQVRYADGERERLGAVEYKLFVGSLNKQATEMDVQEVFSRFGRVEDVYLMRDELKQSRGCGFVKYSDREMALAAIDALNGIYTMRGCDQPLTVRFADPKRPRQGVGDSRGGDAPAFGGPGFGPRFRAPGPRPAPNFGDGMGDHVRPTAWHPMSPQNMGPTSNPGIRSMGSQFLPRSGDLTIPLNPGGPFGGPSDGSLPGHAISSSSTSHQGFNQPSSQVPKVGQQISPLQKPLQSPQHLPPSFQLHPLASVSYSQTHTAHVGQVQVPLPGTQTPFSQALPSQHPVGLSGHLPASRPQIQQNSSSAPALQNPLSVNLPPNLQPNYVATTANQQNLHVLTQQQLLQPLQQSPSQLAQMLSQQTQTLQASFQSSQQAFSQLQQQLQQMQPSNHNMMLQQNPQASKQQWAGMTPQTVGSTPANTPGTNVPSSASPAAPARTPTVAPVECHWTEHTSPDGFKYYHNSLTGESKWEKPEELTLSEQQQQQQQQKQKPPVQQPQTQSHPAQQASQQVQLQTQLQTQIRHPSQLQQPFFPTSYSASGVRNQQNTQELVYGQLPMVPSANDPTRFQQGLQTVQDLAWKNKP